MSLEIESNIIEWAILMTGEDGKMVVGVHPDGSVEYGPGFTADSAAKLFWEAVGANCAPRS